MFDRMSLKMTLCTSKELIITNYNPSTDGLIKVNDDHMGFCRVDHPEIMWDDISQQLLKDHMVLRLYHLYLTITAVKCFILTAPNISLCVADV